MKALILSAGYGTRLRPLTDIVPKILVPIGGKPMLYYHLEKFKKADIKDILINTHWLADQVVEYCKEYKDSEMNIILTHEETLLGSFGTLWANRNFFAGEDNFLVMYGDILSNIDYLKLRNFHAEKSPLISMACHILPDVEGRGMVIARDDGQVTAIKEKPRKEEIVSHLVNGGIYLINNAIFQESKLLGERGGELDFSKDLLPFLLEKHALIYAYTHHDFLMDIGSPENYKFANENIIDILC